MAAEAVAEGPDAAGLSRRLVRLSSAQEGAAAAAEVCERSVPRASGAEAAADDGCPMPASWRGVCVFSVTGDGPAHQMDWFSFSPASLAPAAVISKVIGRARPEARPSRGRVFTPRRHRSH